MTNLRTTQILQRHPPFCLFGNPFSFFDLLPESQVLVHVVLFGDALPVISDFRALGEFLAPLCIRREAGLVYMRWNVTSRAGICVFEPSPALGISTLP